MIFWVHTILRQKQIQYNWKSYYSTRMSTHISYNILIWQKLSIPTTLVSISVHSFNHSKFVLSERCHTHPKILCSWYTELQNKYILFRYTDIVDIYVFLNVLDTLAGIALCSTLKKNWIHCLFCLSDEQFGLMNLYSTFLPKLINGWNLQCLERRIR